MGAAYFMRMTVITFRATDRLHVLLREEATRLGISVSDVIRRILDNHFDQKEGSS